MNIKEIEELVRRVLEELKRQDAGKKQILLIIDDNKSILGQMEAGIKALKSNGFSVVAITTSRMKKHVSEQGLFDGVYDSSDQAEAKNLIEKSAAIGVSSIRFSSLVKVCMGISDSPLEKAIAKALAMGRGMTFCVNGCLPEDMSERVSEGYLRMIVGHLKTVVSYGCALATCTTFAQNLTEAVQPPQAPDLCKEAGSLKRGTACPCIDQRVITKKDILAYRNACEVAIPAMALITDEAKEYAVKEKISIMRKLI